MWQRAMVQAPTERGSRRVATDQRARDEREDAGNDKVLLEPTGCQEMHRVRHDASPQRQSTAETSTRANKVSRTGQSPLLRRRLLHRSPSWHTLFQDGSKSASECLPSEWELADVTQATSIQTRQSATTISRCEATTASRTIVDWTCDRAPTCDDCSLSDVDVGKEHLGMQLDELESQDRSYSDCGESSRCAQLRHRTAADSSQSSSQTDSNDIALTTSDSSSVILEPLGANWNDALTPALLEPPTLLRQRRSAPPALADRGMQTSNPSSYDDEETASFLPGSSASARKPAAGKRARLCLNGVLRRRRLITALCFVTTLSALGYLFAPHMLGEERMQRLDDKFDTALRPLLHGIGFGPPPPMDGRPPPPPPPSTPIATTASGNKIYKPITKLPLGYDDPIPAAEDAMRISLNAFPPETIQSVVIVKPVDLAPQLDANPHHGQIPSVQLSRLRGSMTRQRPPMPSPIAPYPASMYTSPPLWSAEHNGSRTTYQDALRFNEIAQGDDWRQQPYNTWKAPKLLNGETSLPTVQHKFTAADKHSGFQNQPERDTEIQERQQLVKGAFLYAWEAYKARAWGHDEIKPVSGTPSDSFNGWGATIVDALDTLLVMDLPDEYDLARQHVRDIDFHLLSGSRSAYGSSDGRIPVFETAIRYLGGFISAYDLTGDVVMRDRAEELAQLILPAFNTPTGVPLGRLRFADPPNRRYSTGGVILAEAASMLLEMTRLWQVTGNRTYFDSVQRTTDWLDKNMTSTPDRLGALLPTSIFPERGTMYGWYSWGGMVDSAYEYLIKEHQLLGGKLSQYGRMFGDVVDSAQKWLIRDIHTVPNAPLLVLGHSNGRTFQPKLEHLTCFAGGTIGLGARLLPHRKRDLAHAERIAETCWWTYNATTTGIGPEEITFYKDKDTDRFETMQAIGGTSRRGKARGAPIVGVRRIQGDYRNRPETIESVFYMWRITGDPKWQERGWQMFSSWVTHGMSLYGFSSIFDVMHVPVQHTDSQESFVFAETFKYYYLLFSPPELISLDDYVFTTEAHPLLVPKSGIWARAGHGPRKLWDPAASHVPSDPSKEYAGGELGPQGGLTHVQKSFLSERHRASVAAAENEKKAKDNSLLNVVKLNSEHIRNILQNNMPAGSRLTVDDLKNAVAQASTPGQSAQGVAADTAPAEVVDVVVEKRDDALQNFELVVEEQAHEHPGCGGDVAYNADGSIDEYYESDGYGECPV